MKTLTTFLQAVKARALFKLALWRANRRLNAVKRQYPGCEGAMNANSWPPVSGVTTGYEIEGVTTVRFGSNALLQSPVMASGDFLVVTRFNLSTKKEIIELGNGTGIQSSRIRLTHGYKWEMTVRDDTNITGLQEGATAILTDAGGLVRAAHNSSGAATSGAAFAAKVIDTNYEAAPKQPGERVIMLEALLLIEGTGGKLQNGSPV